MLIVGHVTVHAQVPNESEIEDFVEERLDEYNIPNASLAIILGKDDINFYNWGEGSSETAAYLIGSLSKPVTSFAILNLADQGEINIDNHSSLVESFKWDQSE